MDVCSRNDCGVLIGVPISVCTVLFILFMFCIRDSLQPSGTESENIQSHVAVGVTMSDEDRKGDPEAK